MNKLKTLFLVVFVVLFSFLAACSNTASNKNVDPKQLITDAITKAQEMKSYSFDGEFTLSMEFNEFMQGDMEQFVLDLLRDVKVNYKGSYQEDIERIEAIFELQLNIGDLKTTVDMPIMINGEKVSIKIPNIPDVTPPEIAGKYVEMDLRQAAEMSGEEYVSIFAQDAEETQAILALAEDILDIVLNNINDEYFTVTTGSDTVVSMDFGGDRIYDVIDNTVQSLPQIIEVLENSTYTELLGISQSDIAEMKEELKNGVPADFKEEFEQMKEYLEVHEASGSYQINKDGFITGEDFNFDISFTDPNSGETVRIALKGTQNVSNINEAQEFSLEAPEEDVVDFMELIGLLMMGGMGFDEDYYNDNYEDIDFDRITELQMALYEEEWFIGNEVEELFYSSEEFFELLYDEEFLEMLLLDEAARKAWFSQYGIEL